MCAGLLVYLHSTLYICTVYFLAGVLILLYLLNLFNGISSSAKSTRPTLYINGVGLVYMMLSLPGLPIYLVYMMLSLPGLPIYLVYMMLSLPGLPIYLVYIFVYLVQQITCSKQLLLLKKISDKILRIIIVIVNT